MELETLQGRISFKFEMKVYDLCCQNWHSNVESVGFWLDSLQFAIFYENFGRINWYYNAKTPSWTVLIMLFTIKMNQHHRIIL